jgi:hypothetical protein
LQRVCDKAKKTEDILYIYIERDIVAYRRDGGGEVGEGTSSRPAVHFCQDPQHTGDKEALYQKPPGIQQRKILELLNNNLLKVPKCEIFDPSFLTPINPIWVGELRTGEKKKIRRPRQIFAILFFLRRLSLR